MTDTWLDYDCILIKGNHIDNISKFFEPFGYQICTSIKDEFSDNPKSSQGSTFVSFAISVLKGWTVIYDASTDIVYIGTDGDKLKCLLIASKNLKTNILTVSSFQYFIVNNGELIRGFSYNYEDSGKIDLDIGNPPQLSDSEKIGIDSCDVIRELTGVSCKDIINNKQFTVKTFIKNNRNDYSHLFTNY